jgi:pyrroline-5-carboxylate reductase
VKNLKIAFLGTGSMGSAVLNGLIAAGHPKSHISATTKSESSAQGLREIGVAALSLESAPDANQLLAADAHIIVLGVKPGQIIELLQSLQGEIDPKAIVISMAAGITLEKMQAAISNENLIRTMPNTPALVGLGVTGIAAGAKASPEAVAVAQELFSAVGEAVLVGEDQIPALGAISGSGPAWLYYIIEQWEQVALEQGFTQEQAQTMVRGTLQGSAKLLAQTGLEPAQLRKNVTSPGGTTERMIATYDQAGLKQILESSLQAAVARSRELAG